MGTEKIKIEIDVTKKRYELLEDLIVKFGLLLFVITKGFWTDFGSVPKIFWNIISPWDRQCLVAFITHDYLYFKGNVTREEADDILYELIRAYGGGWFKAQAIYRGVRAGGWVAWNEHRKREREKASKQSGTSS